MTTPETLDEFILSAATDEWQKTAVLISKVFDNPAFDSAANKAQDVAERLYILVDNGRLEATGNMRRWRDSNIRLVKKA